MTNGAVIENLSNRKLFTILTLLFICQLGFFLFGAIFAPGPSTSMEFLMTKCKDKNAGSTKEWFYIRPKHCEIIYELNKYNPVSDDARDIVFVAQMPHAKSGIQLEYSSWFQFLVGFLEIEIEYNSAFQLKENSLLQLEVKMAYRNHYDNETQWNEFISTTTERTLTCHINSNNKIGYLYNCTTIDLFELGSNNYPFYLLNIRFPVNRTLCKMNKNAPNCAIGRIHELRLIAAHQNGGFTAIWLGLKTFISPFIIFATIWYYKRVDALNRHKYLLEKSIFALGCSLIILDVPIEWFLIFFRLPALVLLSDLRQGLFYTILFSFWIIFTGEHLIEDENRNTLRNYWFYLLLIGIASTTLLIYDLADRGRQLFDPFANVWASSHSSFLAKSAIMSSIILILIYFVFLCYKIWKVWTTIRRKRQNQYFQLNQRRRFKLESIIYRFKFLMILTLICAVFTIFSYTMQEYDEGKIFDYDEEPIESRFYIKNSVSAFFTGTFGMWNIYVCLLLFMYAPSYKNYANKSNILQDENEDLMDPSFVTESTQMSVLLKSATD